MASSPDFVQYIVDQCSGAGVIVNNNVGSTSVAVITVRKMFGDYCVYCDGKPFGLVCDNGFYVKPTEAGRKLLRTEDMRPPYEGAKPHFYIEDVDDRDYLAALVKATCAELPEPKPKVRKKA